MPGVAWVLARQACVGGWTRRPHGAVEGRGLSAASEFLGMLETQASTRGYAYAVTCLGDQSGEHGGAGENRRLAPRGQKPMTARGYDRFKREGQDGSAVEGTVKGNLKRCRTCDKVPSAFNIHVGVRMEKADDDPGGAKRASVREIVEDEIELGFGIDEVASARTEQDVHRELRPANGCGEKRVTWCQPPL